MYIVEADSKRLTDLNDQLITTGENRIHCYCAMITVCYALGHMVVCRSFIHSFRHFHEFLLTQASAAAANRFIGINQSRGAFKIVRILI